MQSPTKACLSELLLQMVHSGSEVKDVNLQIDWPKFAKNRAPVILTSVAMLQATKAILSMGYYEKQLGWLKKAQKDQPS